MVMKQLFVLLFSSALATTVAADVLEQHLWQSRLLILAAPSMDDPGLRQQRGVIPARRDAIDDRDLRVYELIGEHGLRDGEPISDDDVAEMRARFALQPDDSVMILIGLDGREKRRAPLSTPLTEVFLQIDTMPMRRAEIRARRAAGEPLTDP